MPPKVHMPTLKSDLGMLLPVTGPVHLDSHPRVLVAHRRAPIQRMIRTNLEADGLVVATASTPAACLADLNTTIVSALVLDAELIRDDGAEGSALLRFLLDTRTPTLLISWDPGDRLLARTLHNAPFISRPDNIDLITDWIQRLLAEPVWA
jgi:DNA-binding response OmpR family regulator